MLWNEWVKVSVSTYWYTEVLNIPLGFNIQLANLSVKALNVLVKMNGEKTCSAAADKSSVWETYQTFGGKCGLGN